MTMTMSWWWCDFKGEYINILPSGNALLAIQQTVKLINLLSVQFTGLNVFAGVKFHCNLASCEHTNVFKHVGKDDAYWHFADINSTQLSHLVIMIRIFVVMMTAMQQWWWIWRYIGFSKTAVQFSWPLINIRVTRQGGEDTGTDSVINMILISTTPNLATHLSTSLKLY